MSGMVIIGAGQAAGQAAASLRQEKYEGSITIIGDEPHLPYQRPPLSKQYLSGDQPVERVYLRPQKFYDDKNVTLKLGMSAQTIDRTAKQVTPRFWREHQLRQTHHQHRQPTEKTQHSGCRLRRHSLSAHHHRR